ncbi:hypothetical protein RhiirB3_409375 [Rhizophagus irregularis]|nr:hypothetical protein RhiirB3_409375 [Rhizophagus irregularis]
MKKLFKAMQILIFYQCQYHLTHVTSDSYDEKTVKSVLAQLFGKTELNYGLLFKVARSITESTEIFTI